MRNHSRKHRLNNSGLTLIELIVAIAIIAIFSGVVLTYITSSSNFYRNTSSNSKVQMETQETFDKLEDNKLRSLALAVGLCDKHEDDKTAARMFIDAIKDMKKRFGIGDYIPEIQETDIPELAHYADKEANPLYPVPVLMDASELETLYYRLMSPAGSC